MTGAASRDTFEGAALDPSGCHHDDRARPSRPDVDAVGCRGTWRNPASGVARRPSGLRFVVRGASHRDPRTIRSCPARLASRSSADDVSMSVTSSHPATGPPQHGGSLGSRSEDARWMTAIEPVDEGMCRAGRTSAPTFAIAPRRVREANRERRRRAGALPGIRSPGITNGCSVHREETSPAFVGQRRRFVPRFAERQGARPVRARTQAAPCVTASAVAGDGGLPASRKEPGTFIQIDGTTTSPTDSQDKESRRLSRPWPTHWMKNHADLRGRSRRTGRPRVATFGPPGAGTPAAFLGSFAKVGRSSGSS